MFGTALPLLLLVACSTTPTNSEPTAADQAAADRQLEAAGIATDACPEGERCDGGVLDEGPLAVTRSAGVSSVELTLTVGETVVSVHSPTGADLAEFIGTEVTAAVGGDVGMGPSLALRDAQGFVYVIEGGDGTSFAPIAVQFGAELGRIVDGRGYEVTFYAIDIATDDGVVSVEPGQVVTLSVDGQRYRFGAIAAYVAEEVAGVAYLDCGAEPPMLSYELVRIDEELASTSVTRPAGSEIAAVNTPCG
jgi:hypothetical protein